MTVAELAILSLIVQEPRHGYQVEQVINERGMRDWAEISFSSIYYILNKLEAKRYISSEMEDKESGGPPRKVYRVTDQGKGAWHESTLEMLSSPKRYSTPLLVGLANLPGLTKTEALSALSQYCHSLEQRDSMVQANWTAAQASGQLPWHAEFMFDLSLKMTRAELSWVRNLISQLSDKQKGKFHA